MSEGLLDSGPLVSGAGPLVSSAVETYPSFRFVKGRRSMMSFMHIQSVTYKKLTDSSYLCALSYFN